MNRLAAQTGVAVLRTGARWHPVTPRSCRNGIVCTRLLPPRISSTRSLTTEADTADSSTSASPEDNYFTPPYSYYHQPKYRDVKAKPINRGTLEGFMKWFVHERDPNVFRHMASESLFTACSDQADRGEFYTITGLEPNFRARQAFLTIHVWLLHRKLGGLGDPGKMMQEMVFDRCWEECMFRIRELEVPEISVNKSVKDVQQLTFNACIAYDKAVRADDPPKEFGEAFKKHVFAQDGAPTEEMLEELLLYVYYQMKAINNLPSKELLNGYLRWMAPSFHDKDNEEPHLRHVGVWRHHLTIGGKGYYWNVETGEVKWTIPEDRLEEASTGTPYFLK